MVPRTECFGPVLGMIRADDLDHAIRIQNGSDYGLTAGLQSLDPDEIARWTERVEAGNLYVNRGITGAIVRRQPFGGWKRSVVGPTAKAGGPNYVNTLARWHDTGRRRRHGHDCVPAMDERHRTPRARPVRTLCRTKRTPLPSTVRRSVDPVRIERGGPRARADGGGVARVTGARTVWSDVAGEPAAALCARLGALGIDRLRLLGDDVDTDGHDIRLAAHAAGLSVDDAPPVGAPEIELPRWLREQTVTTTMHRHGRLLYC